MVLFANLTQPTLTSSNLTFRSIKDDFSCKKQLVFEVLNKFRKLEKQN